MAEPKIPAPPRDDPLSKSHIRAHHLGQPPVQLVPVRVGLVVVGVAVAAGPRLGAGAIFQGWQGVGLAVGDRVPNVGRDLLRPVLGQLAVLVAASITPHQIGLAVGAGMPQQPSGRRDDSHQTA